MDVTTDFFNIADSDIYYYHLDIQPADIVAVYRNEQLIIQDSEEKLPTQSPALQLICIAQERNIPVKIIPNHWKNGFTLDSLHILLFIKTVGKAYPLLANYLQALCRMTQQQPRNSTALF